MKTGIVGSCGNIAFTLTGRVLNQKSRNAILRIGAKEEGTLRKHLVTWTGRIRDTVYFSILDSEWPEVKAKLEARLDQRLSPEGRHNFS